MSATILKRRTVKGHVIGIERLEPLRWRVTIDGHRLFTFCSEARARQAGVIEARRLALVASGPCEAHTPGSSERRSRAKNV